MLALRNAYGSLRLKNGVAALILSVGLSASGCGRGPAQAQGAAGAGLADVNATTTTSSSTVEYQQAVNSFASGAMLERLNAEARDEAPARDRDMTTEVEGGSLSALHAGAEAERAAERVMAVPLNLNGASMVMADPCPRVPAPDSQSVDDDWAKALGELRSCLRKLLEPAMLTRRALGHYITYTRAVSEKGERNESEKLFSVMSDTELAAALKAEAVPPASLMGKTDAQAPLRKRLRNRFEGWELDEMRALAVELNDKLVKVEAKFYATVDWHLNLVQHFAKISNRYELLLLLRDSAAHSEPAAILGQRVSRFLEHYGMQVPRELGVVPVEMLRPWAVKALSPDEGHETDALEDPTENPFMVIQQAMSLMGGPEGLYEKQRSDYLESRGKDNTPLMGHPAPVAGAARIAVVDTGVDYVKHPEFMQFLGDGKNGSMKSYDFQDDDEFPYLAVSDDHPKGSSHTGTGTTASVLSVIAHGNRDLLDAHKIDLAMWKIGSNRDLLGEPFQGTVDWKSRQAMPEALIREMTDPSMGPKPKIVSISAVFSLEPFLLNSGHPDAVRKAPWLWVMAAGNEGVNAAKLDADKAKQITPSCLNDVPESDKVSARILCVGAVTRAGILDDLVAKYSNTGNKVDLYAYETYNELCQDGTSCSTPAIAGAAAVVAARYPALTPEEIKEALMSAAKDVPFLVDGWELPFPVLRKPGEGAPKQPTIKFLDPASMMPKILEKAWFILNTRTRH